jgi:uncharacterized membrane protein YiaA
MSTHEEEALQENFLITIIFLYIHINNASFKNNKEGIYLYAYTGPLLLLSPLWSMCVGWG